MQPELKLITIKENEKLIGEFLYEIISLPRINILKWSELTHQTSNIKLWYPWQHLASLITGMKWVKTGARGNDICDWTEVKSCSRVDQLDKCKDCKSNVSRQETECGNCWSTNIDRKEDSKWLFSIRDENELDLLVNKVPRVFLLLSYYPNFSENDFNDICIEGYEIWPSSDRNKNFKTIMTNYYYKIFLEHKKENPNKSPAPKNFWPFSYQFYLCNPIKVFSATIENYNTEAKITINHYVQPDINRDSLSSEDMPTNILKKEEIEEFRKLFKWEDLKLYDECIKKWWICEEIKKHFPLRDTDKISNAKEKYNRLK